MLSSKKIVVTVALTLVACLSFSNTSFAKDQKSPMMSGKTKMGAAPKSLCASTSAYAHKEPQIQPPTVKLPVKNRTFTLDTNCGQIVIEADGADAPLTVLVMTALAKGGYFNKTLCHRLTTNGLYVLQCGDPTASGKGGPLFTLGANYTRWGTIVKGLDILKAVAAQGVLGGGTDGTPKQAVGIEKVSVK